jgi:hypothetical protein
MHLLPAWIAKKLKEHMDAEEKDKVLEEEEVTKHMEFEEGEEAAGKNTEEEDMVEREGEVTKRTEEEGGEIAEHMVDGEGEVTRSTEEEVAEEVGEIAEHMVEGGGGGEEIKSQHTTWIHLDEAQYAHILHNLFPKSSSSSRPLQAQDRSLVGNQATKATTATLGEDQIKQMIQDAKKDMLRELQEAKYDKSKGTGGESGVPNQNPETVYEKISQMIDNMKRKFKEQLKIKGLVEEIKKHLNNAITLFILKVDELMDISTLEDTRNALSLLNTSSDIMIVTTTKMDSQVANCWPIP